MKMFSPKVVPGAQAIMSGKAAGKTRVKLRGLRRTKTLSNLEELTLDTDVWLPADGPTPAGESAQSSPSPQTPSSPSPPASIHYGDDEITEAAPYFAKIASWQRDVTLPEGEPRAFPEGAITLDPSGARLLTANPKVLLAADASVQHDAKGLKDLMMFGLTRYATRLNPNPATGGLIRTRLGGKRVAVKSGTYAFVIDQDQDLLVSLTAAPKGGAPAGAHLNLVAGLPVLFAGELTIQDGRIVCYTPQSGSYRTPLSLVDVAQQHPLLADATFEVPVF
jgi:hypothetical protein